MGIFLIMKHLLIQAKGILSQNYQLFLCVTIDFVFQKNITITKLYASGNLLLDTLSKGGNLLLDNSN